MVSSRPKRAYTLALTILLRCLKSPKSISPRLLCRIPRSLPLPPPWTNITINLANQGKLRALLSVKSPSSALRSSVENLPKTIDRGEGGVPSKLTDSLLIRSHLLRMAMNPARLWLCPSLACPTLQEVTGARESMSLMPLLPQLTPFRLPPPCSNYRGVVRRTSPSSLCL